ncbi:hypothetical protein BC777_0235 [Yoonia maricola]|uniref:Uncharacterized protein n=1 Tax=Yoonia maricola TaxID=420999 RepID=A0A2M8WKG0_9RHOB|nr:hypothetical protein [Yoonia maricola]PJI91407.1 hypothetical protein BC777_0235 [Yoonia maricola]
MDVTLRTGADYTVRIVERPGLWMDEAALAALSADLRRIAARTLEAGSLTYGVFSGKKEAMEAVIITLVSRRDGTPVAFNALAVMKLDTAPHPTDMLHLGLVMVDADERSKNLSWVLYGLTCFLIFFRRQFRPVWVSNVTQVPAVVGMVTEMFSDVWPSPHNGRRTLNHLLLAREIMAMQRHVFGVGVEAGFDEERFVITDAYTGGSDDLKKTWEAAPKHRIESYNSFCQEALNYGRGDDVLQLGQMDLAAMRRYLTRDVPKSAVIGLMLTAGLIALQRIVLPAVHWADSTQTWSILRPHRTGKR